MAKQNEPGTEIAAKDAGTVDIARPALQFRDYLHRAAEEGEEGRAFEVAADQLDKILTATTYDGIMDADMDSTYETRDLVGFELEIAAGIRIVKSDAKFNSPLGVYVQFNGTALMDYPSKGIVAGQDMIISSGAPLIIGKLRTLEANEFLPTRVKIVGVDAPSGTVLKLGKIPSRPVTA